MRARPTKRRPRGSISPVLIAILVLGTTMLALVVGLGHLDSARQDLGHAADAAALAAAGSLVDDSLFLGDPGVMPGLFDSARDRAREFAARNPVDGRATTLRPRADVAFGFRSDPAAPTAFVAPSSEGNDQPEQLLINTVRVVARRTVERGDPVVLPWCRPIGMAVHDVAAAATATVDRDVIGFRPIEGRPLPMVPVGIISDPTLRNPWSWQSQTAWRGPADLGVHSGGGQDQHRSASKVGRSSFEPGSDRIPEIRVCLARNAALLDLGAGAGVEPDATARQIADGLALADLAGLGGRLVLLDGRLVVPTRVEAVADGESLEQVRADGQPRIWPLIEPPGPGQGSATLVGFVAARIVRVEPAHEGTAVCVLLQPAMMAVGTAITAPSRRGDVYVPNPYLAKVRLVE